MALVMSPLCSSGAPGQAASAEACSAFAPKDMEMVFKTSGFFARNLAVFFLTFSLSSCTGRGFPDDSFAQGKVAGLTSLCYSCVNDDNFSVLCCAAGFCSGLRQILIDSDSLASL